MINNYSGVKERVHFKIKMRIKTRQTQQLSSLHLTVKRFVGNTFSIDNIRIADIKSYQSVNANFQEFVLELSLTGMINIFMPVNVRQSDTVYYLTFLRYMDVKKDYLVFEMEYSRNKNMVINNSNSFIELNSLSMTLPYLDLYSFENLEYDFPLKIN